MSSLYRLPDGHPPNEKVFTKLTALLPPSGVPYKNCIQLLLPYIWHQSRNEHTNMISGNISANTNKGGMPGIVSNENRFWRERRRWEEVRATVRGPPRARGWNARRELEHDSKDSSTTDWRYWSWRGDSGPFPRAYTMCHARSLKLRSSDTQSRLIRTSFQYFMAISIKWLNYFLYSYFKLNHTVTGTI